MKQHQRISQRTTAQRTLFPIDQQQTSRRTMNRWLRTSLLLVFTLLVVAFLAAALIAWRPFIFNWQMRMIETSMTSEADYAVHLKDNAIDSIQIAPADAVYLDELVDAVEPTFRVHFTADRTVTGTARTTINAILQAHQPGEGQPIVLRTEQALQDPVVAEITGLADYVSDQTVNVTLDPFREQVTAIRSRLNQTLAFELVIVSQTFITLDLPGGSETFVETASLLIPLQEPVFRITRQDNRGPAELQPVTQTIRYQIHLDSIPYMIFLIAAGLSLLSLILLAATTCSRPKDRFWKTLRQMKRQLKGRLILIADKAWDPAWCVSIADFDSLAETVQKLKQPVYGYVDTFSAWPVAYFYTLSSENNYCYIYTEHPEALDQMMEPEEESETVMPLPILPEADELPDSDSSSEIRPIRPFGSD